jgi:adenylate cyclase
VQTAEDLLKQREIKGLKFALIFRIAFLSLLVGVEVVTGSSHFEMACTLILVFVLSLVLLVGYRKLLLFQETNFLALSGAISDLLLLSILPFVWWWGVGGPSVIPAAFLVKTYGLMPLSFGMIIMNSLSGRWIYVLFVVAGLAVLQLLLLAAALHDPRTIIENSYLQRSLTAVSPTGVVINVIMLVCFGLGLAFFTKSFGETIHEAIRLERLSQQISRYFSPSIYATIAQAGDRFFSLQVGSQQSVAVLFSDLRGFTSLSEKLPPGEVVELLSGYHRRMVSTLFQHQATLDKFLGDGIMATFGTPTPQKDDCLRAVKCALAMQGSLREWNLERARQGHAPLGQTIGIHYGPVVAGNVGTPERLEYTVIGDTVNIASRIGNLCKELREDILISDSVLQLLPPEIKTRALGSYNLRGKETPLDLYVVIGFQ